MRLAAELKAARVDAGLTHKQLAKMIGQSRAQISRLENGHTVDLGDVMQILDALGIDGDDWIRMVTIARDAATRGWWDSNKAMGPRQALLADLEAGAATIREFQPTFVPGLLQTPQFTHARVEAERLAGQTASVPAKEVEACSGRQRMLRRPGGPTYEVILDEVAVRRLAAPPEVVKAQLYHVAAVLNRYPKFSLRVLPVDAVVPTYNMPRTAFSLYTFPDPDDPDVVVVDVATDHFVLSDVDDVKRYDELYGQLRDAAWDEDTSVDYLIEVAAEQDEPG
ncbi:MAG TPA: helix-turn-helix transcriptional regulator [Acidimicrobiales bacterium]